MTEAADVEEGLVDREPLDERRGLPEHLEGGLAGVGVGRHPRRNDHRVRAQAAGLAATHRRPHPVGLRLVAGGEDDARADDHGPPAEPRIVALLDRGVERVEVGVEDGGLGGHERMFASRPDATTRPPSGGERSFHYDLP